MKKFLIKLIFFMAFPISYFGVNMIINYLIYHNQPVPIKRTNILIAGDSHPQKSLNPVYFHDAQNISQPAEPYILTYWKLKKIFKTVLPDTLIIGFAPHNISEFNDLKFSNKRWADEMFKRSYPIEEFRQISNTISVDYRTFYKVLLEQTGFYPKRHHINYIGEYSNTGKSNVASWEIVIKNHYYDNDKELSVSKISINYLDSIISLCNSKKIAVILVGSPLYRKYLENIPSDIMNRYKYLVQKYSKEYIVFDRIIDYYPDSLYLDSDHLNEKGAVIFSKELIEYINKQR